MSTQKDIHAAISALLDTGKTAKDIVGDLKCGKSVVYEVKKRIAARKDKELTITNYPSS